MFFCVGIVGDGNLTKAMHVL